MYTDRVKCQTFISIRIIVKIKIHDYYISFDVALSLFFYYFVEEYKLNVFLLSTHDALIRSAMADVGGGCDDQISMGFLLWVFKFS